MALPQSEGEIASSRILPQVTDSVFYAKRYMIMYIMIHSDKRLNELYPVLDNITIKCFRRKKIVYLKQFLSSSDLDMCYI